MRLSLFQPDMAPNVGAAIRTAACFGVPLDIIEPCGFPLTAKDIKRVAMDYQAITPITRYSSWEKFSVAPPTQQGRTILLTTKGAQSLWDFTFEPEDIILMGRESAGVPQNVHDSASARVYIPMASKARSLNVVVSASITLAEASRQGAIHLAK